MNAIINDPNVLRAVTPTALSAYARTSGWAQVEPYGDYSDVYAGPSLPEIVIPRTQQLGDYALVVAQLITIFARTAEVSETAIYHDLIITNRDVIRARAPDTAGDGSIDLISGAKLVNGARGLGRVVKLSRRSCGSRNLCVSEAVPRCSSRQFRLPHQRE